jgi:hypothetical protein
MTKKFIYLFLALALPGLIFWFLKKFGRNEFSVPVYFENGIQTDSICNMNVPGIYSVPDSVLSKVGIRKDAPAKLVVIYPFIKDDLSEVVRVAEKYIPDRVETVVVSGIPNNPDGKLRRVFFDYDQFGPIVYCLLRVEEPWSVVMLDEHNRIRGFYDGSRRDEMDRLDLELSILLKKYE